MCTAGVPFRSGSTVRWGKLLFAVAALRSGYVLDLSVHDRVVYRLRNRDRGLGREHSEKAFRFGVVYVVFNRDCARIRWNLDLGDDRNAVVNR